MHLHPCCSSQIELWLINTQMFFSTVTLMWVAGVSHWLWVLREIQGRVCYYPAFVTFVTNGCLRQKDGFKLSCLGDIWPSYQLYGSFMSSSVGLQAIFYGCVMWDVVLSVFIQLWFIAASLPPSLWHLTEAAGPGFEEGPLLPSACSAGSQDPNTWWVCRVPGRAHKKNTLSASHPRLSHRHTHTGW